eukprot:COSAG02_NODE_129_length_34796_cov_26.576015_33_plen_49_part_00
MHFRLAGEVFHAAEPSLNTVVLFLDTRVSSTPTWREFLDSRVNFLTVG